MSDSQFTLLTDVLLRAVEQSLNVVVITDLGGAVEYVNPAFCQLTGYSREEVVGCNVHMLKSGQMPPEVYAGLWKDLQAGREWEGEFCNRKKNGEIYWEAATISLIRNTQQIPEHYLKIAENITRQKIMARELAASQERYERVVRAMPGFMFTVFLEDGRPVRTHYYPGMELVTGYTEADFMSDSHLWFQMIAEEDRAAVAAQIQGVLKEATTRSVEHRIRHKGGSIRWVRNVSVPTFNEQGRFVSYDGLISDITERKEAQLQRDKLLEEVGRMAVRDPLTGLLNRRGFDEEFNRAWQLGERHSLPTGLLLMDLDCFKILNDTYGHPVGDAILVEMSRLIMAAVRGTDIVSRLGGDEIVVVLPLTSEEETRRIAARVLDDFRRHTFCRGDRDLYATVSIGAACESGDAQSPRDGILKRADQALYRAKHSGGNRMCFYETNAAASEAQIKKDASVDKGMVLLVDGEASVCRSTISILRREHYRVMAALTGERAEQMVRKMRGRIDIVLVDIGLHGRKGLEVLQMLCLMDDAVVGVVMADRATMSDARDAFRCGASDFIEKPFSAADLSTVVERAMHRRHRLQENRRYQRRVHAVIAVSKTA